MQRTPSAFVHEATAPEPRVGNYVQTSVMRFGKGL